MSDQRRFNDRSHHSSPPTGQGNTPRLPDRYLEHGYFQGGYLREELIVTQALELAQSFDKIRLTSGQLRRFYAHVRRVGQRLESNEQFDAVRPAILELCPLAADAVGRAKGTGSGDYELFKRFIDQNVRLASKGRKEFEEGFLPHFQYIVAYFTYLKPRERG